jgi:rod shape determining protein RodA
MLNVMKKIKKKQNIYTVFGIFSLFFYQEIQNMAMTIGLLPITGITLPLISYGGSSIITYLILLGIIKNIENKKG